MTKRPAWVGGTRKAGGSITRLERELHEQQENAKNADKEKPLSQRDLVWQHAARAIHTKARHNRRRGWDKDYAYKYLISMLDDNGKPPDRRPAVLDQSIQRMFAMACVELKVRDRTFPGQRQSWYRERKAEAIKFGNKRTG